MLEGLTVQTASGRVGMIVAVLPDHLVVVLSDASLAAWPFKGLRLVSFFPGSVNSFVDRRKVPRPRPDRMRHGRA